MTNPSTTLDPVVAMPGDDTRATPFRHKQRRPIAIVGLNLVTLGFYSIYWWYSINRELRDLGEVFEDPEVDNEPLAATLAFGFGAVIVVPFIWTVVTTSRRVSAAGELLGVPAINVELVVGLFTANLVLGLFGLGGGWVALASCVFALALAIAALVYMQTRINATWGAYERDLLPPKV